jgi:hypothetical protein
VPDRSPDGRVGPKPDNQEAIAEILALPEVAERLHDFSVTAVRTSLVETSACLKRETER